MLISVSKMYVRKSKPLDPISADDEKFDMKGMSAQLPPATLQSPESQKQYIGLERSGRPEECARIVGFLASGFSSYVTGASIPCDGGASVMNPLTVPI